MNDERVRGHARVKRARYLALHDDLTGLPNRPYFMRRLRIALRHRATAPRHVAVIYLHLDGVGAVTDAHGVAAGDSLLTMAATRLVHSVRAEDFVCRFKAEEFACLIADNPSRQRLQLVACALFDGLRVPFPIGPDARAIRVSIGVALSPEDGKSPDALMHAAGIELSKARSRSMEGGSGPTVTEF